MDDDGVSPKNRKPSLLDLPVELHLRWMSFAGDAVITMRQVNKHFANIIEANERVLADRIFCHTAVGRAVVDKWGVACDSYRKSTNWRKNAMFYRKFWRVFGCKKIYDGCYTSNTGFPFLDLEVFDGVLMRSPLALACIFAKMDPVVEDNPKWFLVSLKESRRKPVDNGKVGN
ncbi:hypothetical protein BC567DRAFT_262635 [Phyllosticta citribraziliensis]